MRNGIIICEECNKLELKLENKHIKKKLLEELEDYKLLNAVA